MPLSRRSRATSRACGARHIGAACCAAGRAGSGYDEGSHLQDGRAPVHCGVADRVLVAAAHAPARLLQPCEGLDDDVAYAGVLDCLALVLGSHAVIG